MKTLTQEKTEKKKVVFDSIKNQIAFQRGMFIADYKAASKTKRLTMQAELMKLGYMLTKEAFKEVSVEWYEDILSFIKKTLGVGGYNPFYKGFPQQVMEMDERELFFNAIIHYWSDGKWAPDYKLERRGVKMEHNTFKMIKLGTEKEFKNIFSVLCSINQSLTENDKEVIKFFVGNYDAKEISKILPSYIPFKETLCELVALGLAVPCKSPTDVLRIAIYLSGGDISLPALPKITIQDVYKNKNITPFLESKKKAQVEERNKFNFKKFKRSERKHLLSILEKTNLDLGEMKLKLGKWLRLGEILHPGEYANRFPKSYEAFDKLRNHTDKIQTFYSKVDEAFEKSFKKGISQLSEKPDEFARKLDWMLRNFDTKVVLSKFIDVSSGISRKVLWELYNHFLNRDTTNPRTVMIKGKKSIKKELEPLPPMSKILINQVQVEILKAISLHFEKLTKLGNVWIDERLKKIPLPQAMRSVNTSVKTYIRGTRIPFGTTKNVIRPYIHWFDEQGVQDLDLSVGFYDKNLVGRKHISYTNLKEHDINSCHSGDIRRRQGACAEYCDIDIDACLRNNIRYALVQVHNFQNEPFHQLKDCVFGMMERDNPNQGEIFIPKTISNAMKIANESSTVCICVLDLKEREYIWADLELQGRDLANIESTSEITGKIIRSLINNTQLSVFDLLSLHAEARGKTVNDKEKAKVVYGYEYFINSYEKIASFM